MIPESQHNDSPTSREFGPHSISNLARTIVVPTTVQFDRKLRARIVEIEYVRIQWALAAKFIACEISVSQMPPKNPLSVGCLLSQQASAIHKERL
jgi:hypothetical protein